MQYFVPFQISSQLSKTFGLQFEASPNLVLWQIVKKYPTVVHRIFQSFSFEDDDRFFDPCSANVYAESCPFGIDDFEQLQTILKLPL